MNKLNVLILYLMDFIVIILYIIQLISVIKIVRPVVNQLQKMEI